MQVRNQKFFRAGFVELGHFDKHVIKTRKKEALNLGVVSPRYS